PQDLRVLINRASEMTAELAAERGVSVELAGDESHPLRCDGGKLQSALTNLLRNAIESGRRVRLRLGRRDGRSLIEIEDDGPGLSEEARQHLFEPFFTTKPNGTGLGLPTAKRFVEAHGGTLEVGRSAALGGARFAIELPPPSEEDPP